MAEIEMPELPPIVAQLVRRGVYAIYSVLGEPSAPYLLATSGGTIHRLTAQGRISAPLAEKRLSDFAISAAVSISESAPPEAVVRINNV